MKVLKIIGVVFVALFILGIVVSIIDPGGRIASKKAAEQVEQAEQVKQAEQAEQDKQGIFKQVAVYETVEDGVTDMIVSYYTTVADKKTIHKFAERFKVYTSRRVLVLFFNDAAHVPNVAQLKDWWTDGSITYKAKKKLFRDYFVACYRTYPKIKSGPKKGFQYTEFTTTACGV